MKDELRFPRRPLLATAALLVLTIATYGLFHPVWVESASAISAPPTPKQPTVLLILRNAGRTSMTIEGVSGPRLAGARAGLPPVSTRLPLRIAGGRTEAFTLRLRPGMCGNGLVTEVRYRVLGQTLREPLRLTASGLRSC